MAIASLLSVVLAVVVNVATSRELLWLDRVPDAAVWLVLAALAVLAASLAVVDRLPPPVGSLAEFDDDLAALLAGNAGVLAASRHRAPSKIPVSAAPFVGRESELARVAALMGSAQQRSKPALVDLYGKPGVGKSLLAAEVARRLAERYPDGQVLVELNGLGSATLSVDDALWQVLHALGADVRKLPVARDARVLRLGELLTSRRVLLLLDDAVDEDQIRPFVGLGPRCGVIVTSRRPLSGLQSTAVIQVQTLPPADAADMLAQIAGRRLRAGDAEHVAELVELCGGLPLALTIAAALLASRPRWSFGDLAARLEGERHRLDRLRAGDLEVRASVALSYAELADDERVLFRRLGLLDLPLVPLVACAALRDRDPESTEDVAERLVDAQLVDSEAAQRYTLHRLLWLYARERAEAEEVPDERDRAARRAVVRLVDRAHTDITTLAAPVSSAAPPLEAIGMRSGRTEGARWPRVPEARNRLEEEAGNLVRLVVQAARLKEHLPAVRLGLSLIPHLAATGRLAEAVHVAEVTVRAAATVGVPKYGAAAQVMLGVALQKAGRTREALRELTPAIAGCLALDLLADAGRGTLALAQVQREHGDLRRSVDSYRKAASLLGRAGLPVAAAGAEADLGQVLKLQGRLDEAGQAMERTLALALLAADRDPGALHTAAWARENLGAVRKQQGHFQEAVRHHIASAWNFRSLSNPVGEGFALRNLGDLLAVYGHHDEALRLYEKSLVRFQAAGHPNGEAQAWISIAIAPTRALSARQRVAALRQAVRRKGVGETVAIAVKLTLLLRALRSELVPAGSVDVRAPLDPGTSQQDDPGAEG